MRTGTTVHVRFVVSVGIAISGATASTGEGNATIGRWATVWGTTIATREGARTATTMITSIHVHASTLYSDKRKSADQLEYDE